MDVSLGSCGGEKEILILVLFRQTPKMMSPPPQMKHPGRFKYPNHLNQWKKIAKMVPDYMQGFILVIGFNSRIILFFC
ncbi:hypothetical protein DKP78_17350 [Enterococcus faecium]|nr:hypothetical protein DKP78_17350 [Enterococcus faecium]